MALQKLLYDVLALLYIVLSGSATTQHYVRSTTSITCPTEPCLTLSDYVSNTAEYFTFDASFIFLEGEHYLNAPLILTNITNMTMFGVDTRVRIILSTEANISYTNSLTITLSSLEILYHGKAEEVEEVQNSALLFHNSHSVQLVNIKFTGLNTTRNYSRALNYIQSTSHITNCSFSNGHSYAGGAIYMSSSNITFSGVNSYTNNTAYFTGGAIYAFISTLIFSGTHSFIRNKVIRLDGGAIFAYNCIMQFQGDINFTNNTATLGGGVYATNSTMTISGTINYMKNVANNGGGVYATDSTIAMIGTISYMKNMAAEYGGGVYTFDSTITLSGTISYMKNEAQDGGGMVFQGTSQLVLKSPVTMNFYHNIAKWGGALLVRDSDDTQCQRLINTKNCFFKVEAANSSSLDIHLNFTQNSAYGAGTALFGGALESCRVQVNNIQVDFNGFQFLQNTSTFTPSVYGSPNSTITSSPLRVCYCNNGTADCSGATYKTVNTVQGRTFNLSVITVGQLYMPVPSRIMANIQQDYDDSTQLNVRNYDINVTCNNVGFQLFTKRFSNTIKVLLYPVGCIGDGIYVLVNIDPCPNGFNLTDNTCKCDKTLTDLNRDITCDIDTGLIERPGNFWIRPILDENQTYFGFIWHLNCPNSYCKQENESDPTWLNFSTADSDNQCTENRTKLLCGSCKHGYSLTLNNFLCRICENKFISLILFFGIAGIALIATLLTLHMTVAAGTVNGLILYANVVNIYGDIFFPDKTHVNPLTLFISWINLDFGIPTCFYDGLDAYSYTWLQYAFPLYLWFLIGLIIFTSKISMKFGELFGSNPVAVLATVVLMSYTKLLQTTVRALLFTYLEYHDGMRKRVWLFDANITYFKGKHVTLATVAICVIIFLLLPYVFLLMFGYHLQAYSGRKYFFWFNKFKPILDAYYAPYNNKTRYWTGFMLFIRGCLSLGFTLRSITIELVAASLLFVAIAVIPWLSNRIYEKLYISILEASFILNFTILLSTTYLVQTVDGNQAVVTYLFVGIAFVEFIGIVIFHLYFCIKSIKFFQNCKCIGYIKGTLMTKKSSNEIINDEAAPTIVATTYIDMREPLLEDN